MLLIKNSSLFAFIFLLSGLFCLSCVDVPSNAPPPPIMNAEFRFISINPDSVTSPANFQMSEATYIATAKEPIYKNFTTIALRVNAEATAFATYNAGSKYLLYLGDTLKSINFETDEKATLVFARNSVSNLDTTKAKFSAYKLPLGYKFNPIRLGDTTLVRFVNLVLGGLAKVQVRLNSMTKPDRTDSVALASSDAFSSAFIKVPKDSLITFFFTGNLVRESKLDSSVRVFKDSLNITGVSGLVKTVFIYDKYDTAAASNANVKIKVLDEN